MNAVNGIFVDPRSAKAIDDIYARFTKSRPAFSEELARAKRLVMRTLMASELNTLGHILSRVTRKNRHTRDFTLNELTEAIVETIAAFSVYRTYANRSGINDQDKRYVEQAVSRAGRRNPTLSSSLFDYLEGILLLRDENGSGAEERDERLSFVMRFQQLTGPIMAKALEDSAFYSFNRLVSLNEVGGSPDRFGLSLDAFHGHNIEISKNSPSSLVATSTHDTKRSEDARARLNVLSEMPEEWRRAAFRWGRINKRHKTLLEGQPMPDRNDEYLLYQSLLSVWPLPSLGAADEPAFVERIGAYMIKAVREAKAHTSWINPDAAYEDALLKFVSALLTPRQRNVFVQDLERFEKLVAYRGALNSLSQTLLKIAAPGVPDFYQGTEIWDLSLVDPDNRRPVDFALRRKMLDELKAAIAAQGGNLAPLARRLLDAWPDGRAKLYLTHLALNYRRRHGQLFAEALISLWRRRARLGTGSARSPAFGSGRRLWPSFPGSSPRSHPPSARRRSRTPSGRTPALSSPTTSQASGFATS